jgi:ketosteroid isomerase-like protein
MSEENVELVRRFYEAAAQRKLKELRWAFTPDFELREARSMPEAETLYGPEATEQWSRKWATMFDYTYVPREIHEAGERVLVEVVIRGRAKQSGVDTELVAYTLWTIRDGKFCSLDNYLDRTEAFAAAGLAG